MCLSLPGAEEAPQPPGAAGPCAAPPHPAPLQVDKGGSSPAPSSSPARPPSRRLFTGAPLPLAFGGVRGGGAGAASRGHGSAPVRGSPGREGSAGPGLTSGGLPAPEAARRHPHPPSPPYPSASSLPAFPRAPSALSSRTTLVDKL